MAGHHHHRAGTGLVAAGPFAQQADAVHVRHPDVEQHQVRMQGAAPLAGLRGIRGRHHLVALFGKNFLEKATDVGFVVHDEDSAGAHACALLNSFARTSRRNIALRASSSAGSAIVTRTPPSARFVASTQPACSSTSFFTIARPSPVPFGLLVTYGSKILSTESCGMPGPLSSTMTNTACRSNSSVPRVVTRKTPCSCPSSASTALRMRL